MRRGRNSDGDQEYLSLSKSRRNSETQGECPGILKSAVVTAIAGIDLQKIGNEGVARTDPPTQSVFDTWISFNRKPDSLVEWIIERRGLENTVVMLGLVTVLQVPKV